MGVARVAHEGVKWLCKRTNLQHRVGLGQLKAGYLQLGLGLGFRGLGHSAAVAVAWVHVLKQ